jgi:hypothetical protein
MFKIINSKIIKFFFSFLTINIFLSNQIFAEIIETDNFTKIQEDLIQETKTNKDILLIVNLDNVIFKLDYLNKNSITNQDINNFYKLMNIIKINNIKISYVKEILFSEQNKLLSEKNLPEILNNLKKNYNIKIIASTNGLTGDFNGKKLEKFKYDILKQHQIDFSESLSQYQNIIFNNLKIFDNTYPILYKGILHSNSLNEYSVILQLLKIIDFRPSILVLVHNDYNILNSLEIHLKSYSSKIKYIAYHYQNNSNILISNNIISLIKDSIEKSKKVKRNNIQKK